LEQKETACGKLLQIVTEEIKISFLSVTEQHNLGLRRLIAEVSRSHTQTHTSDRTPLDEWSARRRGRYLHNKQRTWISMPSAKFEPAIPAVNRRQ